MRMYFPTILICLVWSNASFGQGEINAQVDKFGNPIGSHGLAADGEFKGKRILMWDGSYGQEIFQPTNPLFEMLQRKGFEVETKQTDFEPAWLRNADQLWYFCGTSSKLSPEAIVAIEKFVKSGKGLYLVSDNDPYYAEANILGERLFGVTVQGNYPGQRTIQVRQELTNDSSKGGGQALDRSAAKPSGRSSAVNLPQFGGTLQNSQVSHSVPSHALLTGINFIYEGITISNLSPNDQLEPVLIASDGKILASVAKDPKLKVIMDCGFTRYYPGYVRQTAGTLRYAENVAAYLMGVGGRKPLEGLGIAELLSTAESDDDPERREAALKMLRQRKSTYSKVKAELEELYRHSKSNRASVSSAAREQLTYAFLQAPMSHCLHWISQDLPGLSALIWEQVEVRIARADSGRRESYQNLALKVALGDDFEVSSRLAAMQLLLRLKSPESMTPVVDKLVELPRELWPTAGALLESLTDQDFGPKSGDGLADVVSVAKKWHTWIDQQGSN